MIFVEIYYTETDTFIDIEIWISENATWGNGNQQLIITDMASIITIDDSRNIINVINSIENNHTDENNYTNEDHEYDDADWYLSE